MRKNLIICIVIALALILCPVFALESTPNGDATSETVISETKSVDMRKNEEYISVMSASTGKINRVGMREYVIGCVAAEMSAQYHSEALKAQAVSCYTYAKKVCEQNRKHKDSDLEDADITDSPDTHQGYLSEEKRKEKWDEKFDEYEAKITAAVDEVLGCYLSYNDETALAVYHAISAGRTQSAYDLWNSEIPYLISVESAGDRLSPDYKSTVEFEKSEFKKLIAKCGVKLEGNADEWLDDAEKDSGGYVSYLTVGGSRISGTKIREEFKLRSLCFDVKYSEGKFIFTCCGYGHGVGMSQYGADYMARQGFSWKEILLHYYPNTELCKDSVE